MDELVRWLGEQLDEDERIARAATQGEWVWSREFVTPPGYHPRTVGPLEPGDAAFIAAHDPARVLREIDAKRRQVEWCVEVIGDRDLSHYDEVGSLKDAKDALAVTLAVETLRLLALPYADRPGYQESWRP